MCKLTPPSVLSLGLVTVLGLGSAVAQAAASETHTVDFTGRIYQSGCQIDNDNSDKTVNLGVASVAFLQNDPNFSSIPRSPAKRAQFEGERKLGTKL